MYHSITIGDKNTWDDWHMIPVTPPVIAPPVEKTISLDVEGRNGAVYLSKSVTGEAVFKAREGSWEFYLDTESWRGRYGSSPVGKQALDHLAKALNEDIAKPMKQSVRLEDDPAFFYFGRVWMSGGIKQQNDHTVITLKYSLYPFKYLYNNIQDDWLWDPFNFTTDLALPYAKNLVLKGQEQVNLYLPPSEKPSVVRARGGSGVVAGLYKSRTLPYRYAGLAGLYTDHTEHRLVNNIEIALGVIDDDLRYDVYELKLKNMTLIRQVVNVTYLPAYL